MYRGWQVQPQAKVLCGEILLKALSRWRRILATKFEGLPPHLVVTSPGNLGRGRGEKKRMARKLNCRKVRMYFTTCMLCFTGFLLPLTIFVCGCFLAKSLFLWLFRTLSLFEWTLKLMWHVIVLIIMIIYSKTFFIYLPEVFAKINFFTFLITVHDCVILWLLINKLLFSWDWIGKSKGNTHMCCFVKIFLTETLCMVAQLIKVPFFSL